MQITFQSNFRKLVFFSIKVFGSTECRHVDNIILHYMTLVLCKREDELKEKEACTKETTVAYRGGEDARSCKKRHRSEATEAGVGGSGAGGGGS